MSEIPKGKKMRALIFKAPNVWVRRFELPAS